MDSGIWRAPAAGGPVRATPMLPGSKSITNRALVLAALSDTPSQISGALRARDTELAINALRALGCVVEADSGGTLTVKPGQPVAGASISVDVGNSGTVMRFLPGVAALTEASVGFDGDPRARERPVGGLLGALRSLGVAIDDGGRGALPFTVSGRGAVPGGTVMIDASASSQFVSGILLAAPRFSGGVLVKHSGPPVPSLPHIEMTIRMLNAAGADAAAVGTDAWLVRPGGPRLRHVTVEPDLSNAAPFLAAALVTGGQVTLPGWPADSLQASDQILAVLADMGADCELSAAGLTVRGGGTIRGVEADLREISELSPVLTAIAAVASSPSTLTGLGHVRRHETDRLAALAKEINALGGDVTELPDGLVITPRPLRAQGRPFDSYDDHRMVMAAAVLGLAVPGIEVLNAATVGKTFPDFTALWARCVLEQDS